MATTPDPSTTEWIPLWDLNGIALSSVPPHHATHDTGGTDPLTSLSGTIITSGIIADARLTVNVLKFTGGYPGGNTTFLRADGTFAVPPVPGPVGPHAATHSPGGGDTLINNAWLDTANIFTQDQNITKINPVLYINDTNQVINSRMFRVMNYSQQFLIQATNDALNVVTGTIIIDRTGVLTAASGLGATPLNASNLTSGTVPSARLTNVAVLNVANIFSQNQRIIGTRPTWEVQFSGNPVISRVFQAIATNRIDISANLYYDGGNWRFDDTSQVGTLYIQQIGRHDFYISPAGPSPALTLQMSVTPSGTNIPAGLGSTPLNASQITSGTVPIGNLPANVARTDIDNNFPAQTLGSYSVVKGPNGCFNFLDTSSPVDHKFWRMLGYSNGDMWLEALNDVGNTYISRFGFGRDNNFYNAGLDASALNRGTVPLARLPYEEGYFLPVLGGTGGETGQSYSSQAGNYVKIGNFVHAGVYIQFSNNGSIFGNLVVKNFPYAGGGGSATHAACVGYITNLGSPGTVNPRRNVHGYMLGGSNMVTLFSGDDMNAINMIQMTGADTNIHTQLVLSISYRTNY